MHSLQILENAGNPDGYDILTGTFQIFDTSDAVIYDSGLVSLASGSIQWTLGTAVANAKKVTFTAAPVQIPSYSSIGEFGVIGVR